MYMCDEKNASVGERSLGRWITTTAGWWSTPARRTTSRRGGPTAKAGRSARSRGSFATYVRLRRARRRTTATPRCAT